MMTAAQQPITSISVNVSIIQKKCFFNALEIAERTSRYIFCPQGLTSQSGTLRTSTYLEIINGINAVSEEEVCVVEGKSNAH